MSIRCAVCGSKRITLENKKEGYDLKKGVIGQAVIGIPGALAGMNEKDVEYYHCADCGQVLNTAMSSVESDWIDYLLKDTELWKDELKSQKERYKNIEWNENGVNTVPSEPKKDVLDNNRIIQIEREILEHFNDSVITPEEILATRYENERLDYDIAFEKLLKSGKIVCEDIVGTKYVRLAKDNNEIRDNSLKQTAIEEADNIEKENNPKQKELEDEISQELFDLILNVLNKNPDNKFRVQEIQEKDKKLSELSYVKVWSLLGKLVEKGLVEKTDECKINYYSVPGLQARLKEKIENEKREQRETMRKRNEMLKANNEALSKKIEELEKDKEKQKEIVESNKTRLFGEGAKAKKEAKEKIEVLDKEIMKAKKEIADNLSIIKKDLEKVKSELGL